jgi:hypothetical protein
LRQWNASIDRPIVRRIDGAIDPQHFAARLQAARAVPRAPRITIGCVRLSMKSSAALQHPTAAQQDVTSRFACNLRTKMQ